MYCRALGSSTSTAAALAAVVLRLWVTWYAAGRKRHGGAGGGDIVLGSPRAWLPPPSLPMHCPAVRGLAPCAGQLTCKHQPWGLRCSGHVRELGSASPCGSLHPQDLRNPSQRGTARMAPHLPRMMPLGSAGGCQMSRTKVVLTSGKRIPTGGPGTGGERWGSPGSAQVSIEE